MKKNEFFNQLIYRFMRIGLLPLVLVSCMTAVVSATPTSGQEVLDRKINLVAEQKEVKVVLSEISRLAAIKFVYSSQRIPAHQKVSLLARDRRLSEVLDILLQPLDIFYRVSGNQIVLMKKGDEANELLTFKDDPLPLDANTIATATITGKVSNDAGEPLSGVSVLVKGTSRGTTTGADGNFSITAEPGETLEFSIVGYKLFSYKVGKTAAVNIQLQSDASKLNEIIVIGYGTQKKSTLTGAVASVSGKQINELPVASVDQALQGRVAGVSVTNNGSPGTSPIVAIRGISSISYATDPLYVIDGFPTGNLSSFDSRDIESVQVLKDASAAAIYGSRATNGVIIITTKKGRRDNRMQVTLDSYVGVQSPWKKIDLLNTNQYLTYERAIDGAAGIGLPPRFLPANFNLPIYAGAKQTYAQTNTNWQDAYFKNNALITQHDIGISGGNAVSRYYASTGYFRQDGIAVGTSYERGNFRINSEHNLSKVFTFGENLYLAYGNQHYDNTLGNRTRLTNVVRMQPYIPVYDPTKEGGFQGPQNSFDGADPTNPVEYALVGFSTIKTLKLLGTAFLDVNFTPWLKFRSTFGVDYSNAMTQQYMPIFNDGGTGSAVLATVNNERQIYATKLFTQQLTFDKTFGSHHLNVVGVFERQGQNYDDETATGNQPTNAIKTLNGATNINTNYKVEQNLIVSYVGRLTYDFAGKYLLNASIRRDGLSVFAPGHKYESFPAASIGWKIDQENFMRDIKAISELKVRGGYGITGLNGATLGNYPWEATIQVAQTTYPFGQTLPLGNGTFYNQIANTKLEWEKTKQLNLGLELGLFNNKITFVADYFHRKTDNLIINVPIPPSFGFGNSGVIANAAAMQNNGFEAQLGYHQTQGEFRWDVSGLISVIRNKVLSLNAQTASFTAGGDADFGGGGPITNTVAGQPIQSFYGYVVSGIFQSASEVANSPTQVAGKTAAGDLKFKDLSGPNGKPDGAITDADRTYIGSFIPKFTYSLNYSASYHNFDLSVFFQGVQGNKIFNAERIIVEGMARLFNSGTRVLNAWTPTNTHTDIPRAISGDPNQNVRPSTRWIENGSYLRLKNLMLGYSIPERILSSMTKNTVTRFRIYVASQNLLTFTGYKGWDPEIGAKNGTLTNGIDYGQYPSARSIQVGVQAGF
jgi:TonB-linked SusC/RagA family outer membrane protein